MTRSGNIVNFPERSAIEEDAARWVVRLDAGKLSEAERAEFEAWREASPLNRDALARMSSQWTDLDALAALADTPSPARAWRRPALWGGLAAAAAALVAAVIVTTGSLDAGRPTLTSGLGVYTTKVGDQEKITLADGSIVTLNTGSRIEAQMSATERRVRLLAGEAFFEVAHDASRPFRVYAGDGVTMAVGTAFSVRLEADKVEIVVSEGKVSFSRVADTVEPVAYVTAGEAATFSDNVTIEKIDEAAVSRKLSWTEGRLEFSGQPLSSVVADIARYTDLQFDFEDQELANMRVGAILEVGDVEYMLNSLKTNLDLRVQRQEDGRVLISRAAR